MNAVAGLGHVTLVCSPGQLAAAQNFYESVLELTVGSRPAFDFPGVWLYAGSEPIIHLAGVLLEPAVGEPVKTAAGTALPGGKSSTGAIDHVAFRMVGSMPDYRAGLLARGIAFTEAPVPQFPLHQIFIRDALGVTVELSFELLP